MSFTDDVITATSSMSVTNGPDGQPFAQFLAGADKAFVNGCLGVGTVNPQNSLDVAGALAVGRTFVGASQAPADGLVVAGSVGIGTDVVSAPFAKLQVGSLDIGGVSGGGNPGYDQHRGLRQPDRHLPRARGRRAHRECLGGVNNGSSTGVLLDPGGWGGRITAKETF